MTAAARSTCSEAVAARPCRVLQVLTSACAGGLSTYVRNLLPNLDPTRFETHLVCTHFEGPHFAELRALAGTASVLHLASGPAKLSRLTTLIRKIRPDVVHAHQEPFALVAAALAGVPRRIETVHLAEYWQQDGAPWLRALARRAATAHVVASPAEERLVAASTCPGKVRIIPPGYDGRGIEYHSRDALPLEVRPEPGDFVVGSIGRLAEQKGYGSLVEAAPEILRACPSARFLLVGDGPLRADLERQIADLGLDSRFLITGYRPDAARFLGAMDVFVFPSLWESWGLSAVEAMAAGIPVVATDVEGPRSFLKDGATALLVPPRAPAALAQAVVRLWSDPALRRSLGQQARSFAEERLSVTRFAQAFETLYLGS